MYLKQVSTMQLCEASQLYLNSPYYSYLILLTEIFSGKSWPRSQVVQKNIIIKTSQQSHNNYVVF